MTFEEITTDLPPDRTAVFRTPEELEQALEGYGVVQPTRQTRRGEFKAALAQRSIGSVELFADRYNTSISLHLDVPEGLAGILLPRVVSGTFLASGFNLGDSHLAVLFHGEGADFTCDGPLGTDDIAIPEARFFELMTLLCPTVELDRKMHVVEVGAAEICVLGNEIVDLIGAPDAEIQGERVPNLLATTVILIGQSTRRYRPERLHGKAARMRVAKGVQQFIEEGFRRPVLLEDLCREAGVGARTVQRCFKEYFDSTVTDYIKTVRLDAAYRELITAHPADSSVTKIALRNGFTHLGRFSVAFNKRFGETPSEVLEKQAIHSGTS